MRTMEFTTSEAAAVTGQPVNRIQKLIDAGPIPRRTRPREGCARVLTDADLMFVWVVAHAFADMDLDARLKQAIHDKIAVNRTGPCAVKEDEVLVTAHVTIRGLHRLVDELRTRIKQLERARSLVVSDRRVKGGDPVIRGTRIPVYLVAAMLDQGASPGEIMADYPSLDEEAIALADVYARANPKQGRPRKHPWR